MSNHHLRRALGATMLIAPLCAPLACARRGAAAGGTAPGRPAAGGATGVRPAPGGAADASDTASTAMAGGKTVERLFAGRFPGVTVSETSGGGLQIRIRGGNNSFLGSNEPLYVLDGTPVPPGTGGIVHLNPYDIEKIEVLKNPADVGIYGVRGGNGVIRITTIRPPKR